MLVIHLDFYGAVQLQITRKDPHRRKALRLRNLLQSKKNGRFCRYKINHIKISFAIPALFLVKYFERSHGHPHRSCQKLCLSSVNLLILLYFLSGKPSANCFVEFLQEKPSLSTRETVPNKSHGFLD